MWGLGRLIVDATSDLSWVFSELGIYIESIRDSEKMQVKFIPISEMYFSHKIIHPLDITAELFIVYYFSKTKIENAFKFLS